MTGPKESANPEAGGDEDLEEVIDGINRLFASIVGSEENTKMLFSMLDDNGLLEDTPTDADNQNEQT